ncbi:MAG: cytochrome b5 domain-containing protein [Anaerocolumna sp.]
MKEEYGIRDIINQFQKEISYYSQMEALGGTPYEKNYHQGLIKERTEELIRLMEQYAEKAYCAQVQQLPEETPETVPPEIAPQPSPISAPAVEQPQQPEMQPVPETNTGQRVFTLEELKSYNGEEGQAAFVAVNGVVYDVSQHIGWAGGTHFGLYAGNDLTGEFTACHGGLTAIIEQLPVVGVLV